jgi:hypothetical protein
MDPKKEAPKPLKALLRILNLQKPKASCSAYVFFAKSHRKDLKREFPDEEFRDLSARLGEMWRSMPNEEREYYEELSMIDKIRFSEEKRVYRREVLKRLLKALESGMIQPSQVDKMILPQNKQPRPPFAFFSKIVRPMLPTAEESEDSQSFMKGLTVLWNALNNQQRIPFIQMSKDDVLRARGDRFLEQAVLAILEE